MNERGREILEELAKANQTMEQAEEVLRTPGLSWTIPGYVKVEDLIAAVNGVWVKVETIRVLLEEEAE